jgi:thiol:disulfide interchange protein DsbD
MKALLFSILFLGISFAGAAQDFMNQFIKWTCTVEKIDDSHANLVFSGKLVPEYHIFSLKHDPMAADGTGIVPEFKFKTDKNFKTIGKVTEVGVPLVQKDELGTSLYFENKATFKQKIEILSDDAFTASCNLFFQLCNHEGCLPPFDYSAKFKVSGYKASGAAPSEIDTTTSAQTAGADTNNTETTIDQAPAPIEQKEKKKDSNVVIFIAGFIAGLVALFTPCMFPMIPMTVTFFTKQSKTRSEGIFKALVYGASIVLIYVAFGLIFTAAMGPSWPQ